METRGHDAATLFMSPFLSSTLDPKHNHSVFERMKCDLLEIKEKSNKSIIDHM